MNSDPILVAGATGYVGGRLIPALLEAGYRVRAMARNLAKIGCRPWAGHSKIELVQSDVLDLNSLKQASSGCRAAYYLVHSMIAQKEKFAEADRRAARNMVAAAAAAGMERIIYLGGLAETKDGTLSKHLESRIEVADILQSGPVPTTDLRAPMILGSGSASFEILRYLVERLPIMTTPRWVHSLNQPIAIRNVIAYLIGCLEHDETTGQTYDIGGPDILTYRELLDIYAEEAGLSKRLIIPVPVLTPTLSALWIHLISPVPKSIALPLTEGLTSDAVCTENRIQSIIPQKLLTCREAVRLALDRIKQEQVHTCWMDAGNLLEPEWAHCGDAQWAGGTIMNCGYRTRLKATVDEVWQPISRIGGKTGWYFGNFLWRLRGIMDRLAGGVGLRRGRRHPSEIGVGDALDFWRVLEVKAPQRLLLVAEMRTPGEALLEFQITPDGNGQVELQMLSRFLPKGLFGLFYWYALYPFHQWIFYGMLKSIARSIGKPIVAGPLRFTPKLHSSCRLPEGQGRP
ncbi:MAG: SDR family oxidoreductase [Desulfobacterales bacterium]|nr:MAG: SDR family oxidoreductase [Desulfobacterales bacterium]